MSLFQQTAFPVSLSHSQFGTVLRAILLVMVDVETGETTIESKPTLKDADLLRSIYTAIIGGEIMGGVTFTAAQMAAVILSLSHYEKRLMDWVESHPDANHLTARYHHARDIMQILHRR